MRGHRVVIPKPLRTRILEEINTGHFGINKKELQEIIVDGWELTMILRHVLKIVKRVILLKIIHQKSNSTFGSLRLHQCIGIHADFAGPFLRLVDFL